MSNAATIWEIFIISMSSYYQCLKSFQFLWEEGKDYSVYRLHFLNKTVDRQKKRLPKSNYKIGVVYIFCNIQSVGLFSQLTSDIRNVEYLCL